MSVYLVITGQTPSQKNRKRIAINRATGRPFIVSDKVTQIWQASAAAQLHNQGNPYGGTYPTQIVCVFYRVNKRRYDLDNAYGSVADALVRAEVIVDDSVGYLGDILLRHGGVDNDCPRVEIWIGEE